MSQNYDGCTEYELKVKDASVFRWNVCKSEE